jgi:hypothetical protein
MKFFCMRNFRLWKLGNSLNKKQQYHIICEVHRKFNRLILRKIKYGIEFSLNHNTQIKSNHLITTRT